MHKCLLGTALAMSALFAGSQASQPTSTSQGTNVQHVRDLDKQLEPVSSQAQEPVHAKPADSLAKYIEKAAFRPVPVLDIPVRFTEKHSRRKVKYGRYRWVIM
jgi:hypothetical protein